MARSFNGTSDWISADGANVVGVSSACSISFWARMTATNENYFYTETSSSSDTPLFGIQIGTTNIDVFFRNDGGTGLISSTVGGMTTNTWHHFCYDQDAAGTWQLIRDGSAIAGATYTPSGTFTRNRVTFGAIRRSSTTNFWPGTAAQIASWTRQLSRSEISALAAGVPASYLGPNHYWPLWGGDSPEPDLGNG